MKKLLVVFCLCWVSTHISAQESTLHKKIYLSYLAESVIQPGLRLGYSHEFWEKRKFKKKSVKFPEGKPKAQSIAALYQLGVYSRPGLYTSVPLTASLLYTRVRAKGFTTQYALGTGVDRTFLHGKTYEVNDAGDVSEEKFAGSLYWSSQFSLGFGVDLSKFSNPIPIGIMCKNSVFVRHNYNDTHMPTWLFELEISYTLNIGNHER